MPVRVWLDGRVQAGEDARVPVWDRGFLYGDGVYETVATVGGRPFALPEHLDRLARSAAGIGLPLPARADIEAAVRVTLAAAANPESRVRIIVTRGEGPIDLAPAADAEPRLVVLVVPLVAPSAEMLAEGVAVALVRGGRGGPRAVDPAVKSGNYLASVLALGEARRRGAYEALFVDGTGAVTEGASSNLFAVLDGTLRTPPLEAGILGGITRAKVIALCRSAGLPVREAAIAAEDLPGADEVFITSATRGVLPVTRVDDRSPGDGKPGPVTRRLMALYDEMARREAR